MIDIKEAIKQYEGIIPQHVIFYSESIRFNVEAAAKSIGFVSLFIQEFDEAEGDLTKFEYDQNLILDQIQNFLVHSAAISRFFWPAKSGEHKLHRKRAQHLRRIFKIKDNSPLKSRELRNQLEHFDENLDEYLWSKPIVGHIIPAYIGCEPVNEQVPYHLFRAFFVDTAIYETLGVQYGLDPIVEEMGKLYAHFHPDFKHT